MSEKINALTEVNKNNLKPNLEVIHKEITEEGIKVEEVQRIEPIKADIIMNMAKCTNMEQKLKIMRNKYKLKNIRDRKIYINHDYTKAERRIQNLIREKAKEERAKRNSVKIGYQKLCINVKWVIWEDDIEIAEA